MGTQIEKKKPTATAAAVRLLDSQRTLIESIVPTTLRGRFEWDAIRNDVMLAVQSSTDLQACKPESILAAVLYITRLGLSIGPHEGKAYLVPYKGQCTPIIGAQGKIELAYRSGKIRRMVVKIVHERERFEADYATGEVSHKPPATDRANLGAPEFCWAGIWLTDSDDPLIETMSREQFEVIRNGSRAKNSPAYTNYYEEMWRRSCLNRALKRAPKSRDLWEVIGGEDRIDAGGRVTYTADNAGRVVVDVSALPDLSDGEPEPGQIEEAPRLTERQPAREAAPTATDDGVPG